MAADAITDYPRYFYKCNVCDSTDHGHSYYDYEIVECPSCGTTNMTRWQALPNLSREWAYCEAYGHQWQNPPGKQGTGVEVCTVCGATRDFDAKRK